MMELTSTNPWSENQLLSQELEVFKLFCQTNFKLKPKNWQGLTNTVITDLPRLSKFSQEYYLKIQVWMPTKQFQNLLQQTNKNQQDWTLWQDKLKKFQNSKFTITEKLKNGPSDLPLNQPLPFLKLIKSLLLNPQEDQRWIKRIKVMMKIDRVHCIMYLSNLLYFK